MTYFIGISGPIGSGKSHLGRKLVEHYSILDLNVCYWPFAKVLKEIMEEMTDNVVLNYSAAFNRFASFELYNIEQIDRAAKAVVDAWEQHGKNTVGKKRRFMQLLGTDIGRGILHPDVWIRERDRHTTNYDIVVSDDVRFDNEASSLSNHIGIRPSPSEMEEIALRLETANPGYTYNRHISENALTKEPNYVIPYMFTNADFIKLCGYLNYKLASEGVFEKWLSRSPTSLEVQ